MPARREVKVTVGLLRRQEIQDHLDADLATKRRASGYAEFAGTVHTISRALVGERKKFRASQLPGAIRAGISFRRRDLQFQTDALGTVLADGVRAASQTRVLFEAQLAVILERFFRSKQQRSERAARPAVVAQETLEAAFFGS